MDRALFNSFRVRFDLGLFDDSAKQPMARYGEERVGTEESKRLNLRAAEASLVLLSSPI